MLVNLFYRECKSKKEFFFFWGGGGGRGLGWGVDRRTDEKA